MIKASTFVTADKYFQHLIDMILEYSPKLVMAFIILFTGLYIIRILHKAFKKIMDKRQIDPTLSRFLGDILLWAMRILLFVTFISKLGIETSSFVAILGAAGLAIGLSLQGSLSNFAGGMLIILFKPFRVGHTIEARGVMGTVVDIQIFVTKLINANNQTIFIPNGILSNDTIVNYTMEEKRRADLIFSLSYDTNIKSAKDIVMQVMQSHPKVLKEPAPTVIVKSLTESAIQIGIRPWSTTDDFLQVSSDILEECKEAFEKAGIVVQPYVREASVNKK